MSDTPNIDLSHYSGRTRRISGSPSSRATESASSKRRGKPAASAKILATGLSATAMLGMTTGYALAAQQAEKSPQPSGPAVAPLQTPATPASASTQVHAQPLAPLLAAPAATPGPAAPTTTASLTPTQVAPQAAPTAALPQATSPVAAPLPQVVEIPVETIAPATPGDSGGGWNNQPSSGSN